MKKFTEKDTEAYYDRSDEIYQSFWDKNGSLHWGYFDGDNENNFREASERLTELMLEKSGINGRSRVLDIGCGNGTTTIDLARKCRCSIDGIDLSGVRIKNAKQKLSKQPKDIQNLVAFKKSSATRLPYTNESFDHVWIQATIYHTHDKEKVLREIYRVLEPGGIFVFDDLLKPKKEVGRAAVKYVYERLLFDTPYSFTSYQDILKTIGFEVAEAQDLSEHLKKSYEVLAGILNEKLRSNEAGKYVKKYKEWKKAYDEMSNAVSNGELGWALFVCKKPD